MSKTIRFETTEGKGIGEVSRRLLEKQSSYFKAFLGEDAALWGDRGDTVMMEEVEAAQSYLVFLKEGWLEVRLSSKEELVGFMDLLVFADRIGADHLLGHLCSFLTPATLVHIMPMPFMRRRCSEFLKANFEEVFAHLNTMKHITADSLPLLVEVIQSDDLIADEDKIVEVALALYRKFGFVDCVKEALLSIRLNDVGLVGLDELRGEVGEVSELLMGGLCAAYARHAHLARRTKFIPFNSRMKPIFSKSIKSWPTTPSSYFCRRLSEVSFTLTIARVPIPSITLTPSHTFSEHIPLRCTLHISGTTTTTRTFGLSFCDCNVSHGWHDLGIQEPFLDAGHWTITCYIQFTTEPLPHDCG